jgi:hypothetical protein
MSWGPRGRQGGGRGPGGGQEAGRVSGGRQGSRVQEGAARRQEIAQCECGGGKAVPWALFILQKGVPKSLKSSPPLKFLSTAFPLN